MTGPLLLLLLAVVAADNAAPATAAYWPDEWRIGVRSRGRRRATGRRDRRDRIDDPRDAETLAAFQEWNAPKRIFYPIRDAILASPDKVTCYAAVLRLATINDLLAAQVLNARYGVRSDYAAGGAR